MVLTQCHLSDVFLKLVSRITKFNAGAESLLTIHLHLHGIMKFEPILYFIQVTVAGN